MHQKLIVHTDGGARGNPGPAGIGAVLATADGEVVAEVSETIGVATNNQAEYKAVIAALERAKALGAVELEFFLDSELVVKQISGEYRVKDRGLAPLYLKIYNLRQSFKKTTFRHVRREQNCAADTLVNRALDAVKRKQ